MPAFDQIIQSFRSIVQNFFDRRTGNNTMYSMEDIALGAFSLFFTQSPSFLDYQATMKATKGKSNAETLFQIEKIPSDNPIRKLLDEVSPETVYPIFDTMLATWQASAVSKEFVGIAGTHLLALDGTLYFSSDSIHCEACSQRESKGKITYSHAVLSSFVRLVASSTTEARS